MKHILLAAVLLASNAIAQSAPTVTLTPSVTSGISPVTVTLTWTSSGAATCTASGSWAGSKAVSGSQTITNLTASASYRLDCKAADTPGSATVSWIQSTQNTDGSALTNLAGYRLSWGSSASVLSQVVQIPNAAASSYVLSGLSSGSYFVAVKAYTTTGVESALSNVVSKTVVAVPGASASATATVAVDTQPKPPVVTIDIQAYEIRQNSTGAMVAARVGLIPLGTTCSERQQKVGLITYALVPRDRVDMVNWPSNVKLQDVWAKCG